MLGLILLGFSLGLSNFAATIGIGLSGVTHKTRVWVGIIFGFFEAVMLVVGLLIGSSLSKSLDRLGNYIGGGLLVLVGLFIFWEAIKIKSHKINKHKKEAKFHNLLLTGIAVSIDNLVIGFALSFSHLSLLLTALTITVVSISMSLIGLELGSRLGETVEKWSEELGGAILIIIGIVLALGYL
ncbi:manganese efflux pump [Candidatus Gottesmanbacteria bacterium]|nr:manganese efflux pump [Candidatus Gottesmanbacteria bacterium]